MTRTELKLTNLWMDQLHSCMPVISGWLRLTRVQGWVESSHCRTESSKVGS